MFDTTTSRSLIRGQPPRERSPSANCGQAIHQLSTPSLPTNKRTMTDGVEEENFVSSPGAGFYK
ncbi:hypothetical protein J1614_001671 [Plenodomus biglobosus]|nr:hypothetical protein J1614_001671 [Plenodomus biglobosus]